MECDVLWFQRRLRYQEVRMKIRQIGTTNETRQIQNRMARQRLLAERAELRRQLLTNSGALAALEKIADDDQARVLHDQFVSVRVGRLAYQQLKLVDAALARLEAGTYDTCEDCGSAISAKRLAAIPWADRCITCQEKATLQPDPDMLSRSAA